VKAILIPCLLWMPVYGQSILHYTETSGYDHGTRDVSLAMFQGFAAEHGLVIVNDNDGSTFSDLSSLLQFDAIIFSNTSGAALLDADQRTNFEAYIANGGSVMGIHAATDTYRHSTANGSNTGVWDFYAELIGASVQENPNHVSGTPLYDLSHIGAHTSTANLPDPWAKNEEYYYWEGGYYHDENIPVLEVEETVGPNGEVNSYDAPRPMSWYRELEEGGRVFYTALGHATDNYAEDALFRQHIEAALLWLMEGPSGTGTSAQAAILPCVWPNPARDVLWMDPRPRGPITVYDALGKYALRTARTPMQPLDVSRLPDGVYHLRPEGTTVKVTFTVQH
jgi:type 1 glutamine amidotransferase